MRALRIALAALTVAPLFGCGADDCSCPPTPRLPPEVDGFVITEAIRYDDEGNRTYALIDPRGGTLRTVGNEVHITYESDGEQIEVVYEIVETN
jgi:hypothetical protein